MLFEMFPNAKIKNYWNYLSIYKGINMQVDNILCPFEIQIHTEKSMEFRDNKLGHSLYKLRKNHETNILLCLTILIELIISIDVQLENLFEINF